jgi:hypothetical protein
MAAMSAEGNEEQGKRLVTRVMNAVCQLVFAIAWTRLFHVAHDIRKEIPTAAFLRHNCASGYSSRTNFIQANITQLKQSSDHTY